MSTTFPSPSQFPLPPSPPSRRGSAQSSTSSRSNRSTPSALRSPLLPLSPTAPFRPRLDRNFTSTATVRQATTRVQDSFYEGSTISVNQPVGSLSISPSSRDVCLASRKGLYILDVANLNNAPRFIPQGGTWQIADCQWSPHPATSNLILSTSSQKLLVWDLLAQKCLSKSIDAHARAITDINWHARNPNLMATIAMDAGIRGWDLRDWDRPFMRVCAWGAAGTQVKWNRQHEHWLATAHNRWVYIWDDRKGSIPVCTIKAHDSKIYGIDWDREHRHKLVTCSLDKTIKYWSIPGLASSDSAKHDEYHNFVASNDKPAYTISTSYPVWRARHLPFGHGVVALPQRGTNTLDMYGTNSSEPVQTFEGHDSVVKEFVWRSRGGENPGYEDREFQLITWGKDRTLRIWPVENELLERVGYKYGAPIKVLISRRGAADITYTRLDDAQHLPPPVVNPSGIARAKMATVETAMTRGGGARSKGMDQLEWLTKVVRTKGSPDTSAIQSRIGSISRAPSRGPSMDRFGEKEQWISLKDEVVQVNKIFPRPKIKFEKIDLHHRKVTLTMNGPWANGDRAAFIRIHWSFPAQYPYVPEIPTFELERNPTVSSITREQIVNGIKALRAENRQCLVSTCGFLLGSHERIGRKMVEDDSDSDNGSDALMANNNTAQLIRTCGATFGANGQLVCFFPKQTVLPRMRQLSRSPSASKDPTRNPLLRAMSALSRLEDPRQRNAFRVKSRFRRVENILSPAQAGSTLTIHDVSGFGNPDAGLAKAYGMSLSPEQNLRRAFDAKRLDHAEVWATVHGLLYDQPPPPYSARPPVDPDAESRRDRESWERGMARKKLVLDELFNRLISNHDIQLLTLVSCVLLDHLKHNPPPPRPETFTHRSPEQDYFALPRHNSYVSLGQITPMRKLSRASITPASPGPSSYRNSGWSQILNASSISLRGHITPGSRSSFDIPRTTPLEVDESSPTGPAGLSIPVPSKRESPHIRERVRLSGIISASPTTMLPYKSSGSVMSGASGASGASQGRLGPSSSEEVKPASDPNMLVRHMRTSSQSMNAAASKVSFGSASPLRRNASRTWAASTPGTAVNTRKRGQRLCGVRMELPMDDTDPPELLDARLRLLCEGFKFAYADFLLRCDLLGVRAALLQYSFINALDEVAAAASGTLPLPVKKGHSEFDAAQVCVACANSAQSCPACSKTPVKPLCAYCRLPIKGLGTTCAHCAHRTHAKCFRAHFSASTAVSCPSCLCRCAEDGGTTGRSIIYAHPSATLSQGVNRGTAQGVITALGSNTAGTGRITYASLKSIREADQPKPTNNNNASALGLSPDGVVPTEAETDGMKSWLTWDPAKIGWPGHSGGQAEPEPRGREGRRRIGPFRVPGGE